MKLGIVRMAYSASGGAEKSIERIAEALRKSAKETPEITVFSSAWERSSENYRVERIPIVSATRAGRFKEFSIKALKLVQARSLDIAQTHERIPGFDIFRAGDGCHAAWVDRLRLSRPIRGHWLRFDPYHRLVLDAEQKIASDSRTLIVSNSSLVRDEFCERYNLGAERIVVIPNGINTQQFHPASEEEKKIAKQQLHIPQDEPVVLFVGSGFERKGAGILVQAIAELPGVCALIIGKDKKSSELLSLVKRLKLQDRVQLVGEQKTVQPFLAAADVFCLPSLYDSFPNAVLEALSCDLPCVVTPGVGVAQEIESAGAGFVVERDVGAVAQGIQSALHNRDRLMGAPRKLASQFDELRIAKLWVSTYERLLDQKRCA